MGYYDEYLEHHGILGQKWGVRRFENAAGRLTAAGKSRYNQINGEYQKLKKKVMPSKVESTGEKKKEGTDNEEEKKKGLTDKQKKMIIAGAAIAGTALAAYGGYKLYQLNNKATEGLSKDYHEKAVGEFTKANNLMSKYYENSNNKKLFNEAMDTRDNGLALQELAKNKKYSVGEKAAYLKLQKAKESVDKNDDLTKAKKAVTKVRQQYTKDKIAWDKKTINLEYQKKMAERMGNAKKAAKIDKKLASSPPPIPPTHSKAGKAATDKLAAEASALAKTVTSQGPKSFSKPAQNGASSRKQEQDRVRTIEQNLLKARQESLRRTQSASNVVKINGSQKFSQAAKANDDYVSQMLKKNASNLSQYTMKDLRDLDLY